MISIPSRLSLQDFRSKDPSTMSLESGSGTSTPVSEDEQKVIGGQEMHTDFEFQGVLSAENRRRMSFPIPKIVQEAKEKWVHSLQVEIFFEYVYKHQS